MPFDLVKNAARGFGAGLVGTTSMTAAMFVLQKGGLLGRTPPRLLTERMLARVGIRRKTSRPARMLLTAVMHYGFGGTMGALFEIARSAIAARRGHDESGETLGLAGVAFGTAVWATSYAGCIPAVGLMRPPSSDRFGRPTSMVLAHWIFGGTLGLTLAGIRLASRKHEVTP